MGCLTHGLCLAILKNTLTPNLKIPTWSLCSPHSQKELPGHWTSKKKRFPLEQEHQDLLGNTTQVSMGLGQPPVALLCGRSHFTSVSVIKNRIWILWSSSPKFFLRTAWALLWQPPAHTYLQTVHNLVSKAQEQKVACFEEVEVYIFYYYLLRTTFYKMPFSFIIVSGKKSFIKIVLVWI